MTLVVTILAAGLATFDLWAYRNYEASRLVQGYSKVFFWWASDPRDWLFVSVFVWYAIAFGCLLGVIL